MDGLFIQHGDEYIERVEKESEILKLIARGDGTEVMIQKIQPGRIFSVSPGENSELMEFFYILKGSINHVEGNDKICLKDGDYFYVNNIKETAYFKTESEATLLYVSSRPVFYMLSGEIEELQRMLNKIREKDNYTYVHDVRLQELSMKIGEKLGLSRMRIENLLYASAFHDVGKVCVPTEILNKPGKLTPEEFEYIKKHPTEGRKLLEGTYISSVGGIIEQHHERLDGSGYPFGLKGNEISMEARIIAVVDSFDAMTSDRPYRKAMSVNAALEELKSLVGRHYDSKVVSALEEILNINL